MRITVFGTGYVGLVTGTCMADTGNHVVAVDIDEKKIARLKAGECPIFEPGLAEMLQANARAGRVRFTTDPAEGVRHGEIIFLAVGTPSKPDGSADLSGLEAAADAIADHADAPKIVATKSTVPVGTGARIEDRINRRSKHRVRVVSNPEFLKEGSAVDDFLRPDRVVIGAEEPEAARRVRTLYLPYVRNQRPILLMGRTAAEMTKYAANTYLAMRISFINQIANLCDALDVDVDEVRAAIGADRRIGYHFLYPGAGYGGSCFPKDVQALEQVARQNNVAADLIGAVHQVNQRQRELLYHKIGARFDGQLAGKRFAVWGVTFKPKTDDLREGPALILINGLLEAGASVAAHDPEGLANLRDLYGGRVAYSGDAHAVLDRADALVIVTEWNEFRNPDFDEIRKRLARPLIFDGRNLYDRGTMERKGLEYHSIGRPPVNLGLAG